MNTAIAAIDLTIESITATNDCFYQGKSDEGYKRLQPCLTNIMVALNTLTQQNITFDNDGFNVALSEALTAMEQKDVTLMADILQYDIIEKLEEIKASLI